MPDLETIRHSASHVMAQAVKHLFPDAKFGIGPAIENGFYYDIDLPRPLTPEDLAAIEAEMHRIVQQDIPFERRSSLAGGHDLFEEGQAYKIEIIDELQDDRPSICQGISRTSAGGIRRKHRQDRGVQTAERRGLLARRRAPYATAHLWDHLSNSAGVG